MKPSKLSDFIKKDPSLQAKLELNFKDIEFLDILPFKLSSVTHLDLSFNKLQSLDGIEQFYNLLYLNISNNLLNSLQCLSKISKKETLSVLQFKGNPAARHPNLTPLILNYFPNLRELDGEVINYSTQKDIMQAMELSQQLIPYLYINEQFILKIHREILYFQMKLELFEVTWNSLPKKLLPNYSEIKQINTKLSVKYNDINIQLPEGKIRPITVMEYIQEVQNQLQINSVHLEENIVCKIYRWLYCEIALYMQSQGNMDLQCFLQRYEESFDSGDFLDRRIDGVTADLMKFSQLSHYPQSLLHFPVFGCNTEYMKALLAILHKQISAIQSLLRERRSLLLSDFAEICEEIQSPPSKISYPSLPSQEYCSPSVRKDFVSPSNRNSHLFFGNEVNQFLSPKFRQESARSEGKVNLNFIREEVASKLEFEESDMDITNSYDELSQTIEELLRDDDREEEKARGVYLKKLGRNVFYEWKGEVMLRKAKEHFEARMKLAAWDCIKGKFIRKRKIYFKIAKHTEQKNKVLIRSIFAQWSRITMKSNAQMNGMSLYFSEKSLKIKTFKSFAKAIDISMKNIKVSKAHHKKKVLSLAFKHFAKYVRVFLHKKRQVRQHRIASMKNILKKIMKSWLYFVRPSAKFLKNKPRELGTSVDKLLSKIKQKDKEIASYFRKYKKKAK